MIEYDSGDSIFLLVFSTPSLHIFFFLIIRPPPISSLFPYTTLFRSPLVPILLFILGFSAIFTALGASTWALQHIDRKSTRLNSSHSQISYAVFCLKKKDGQIMVYGTASRWWFMHASIVLHRHISIDS